MANTQEYSTILRLNDSEARKNLDALQKKVERLQQARDKAISEKQGSTFVRQLTRELNTARAELKSYDRGVSQTIHTLKNLGTSSMAQLQQASQALKRQMRNATDASTVQQLGDQLQRVRERMAQLNTDTRVVERTMKNLSGATVRELSQSLKVLGEQIKDVPRHTPQYQQMTTQMEQLRREINKVNTEQGAATKSGNILSSTFVKISAGITAIVASFTKLYGMARRAVDVYADLDAEMVNVQKYTGLAKAEIEEMNEAFAKMDTTTTQIKLNQLAQDAGRLGITAREGVMEFVEAADKINVALGDDLGDTAVRDIGKLAEMFGESERLGLRGAMLSTGSAINELAQSSSASAGYLVDFTARLSGIANQAGMTQEQILGFASVLDQNMQSSEMAATALSQLIAKMMQDPAKFARLAGQEVKTFSNTLRTDANQALLQFFAAMQAKGGFADLAPMFEEMGLNGVRATGVISVMAQKLGDVGVAQRIASDAYRENVSVQKEYNIQQDSTKARLEKLRNASTNLTASLGRVLTPMILSTNQAFNSMLASLVNIAKWTKDNIAEIVSITIMIAALTVAVKAQTVATYAWYIKEQALLKLQTVKAAILKSTNALMLLTRAAYYALTGQTQKAIVAQLAFNKAVLANPYVAVTALLVALAAAIATFIIRSNKATEAQRQLRKELEHRQRMQQSLAEIDKATGEATAEQIVRIRQLNSVARDQNAALADRKRAIAELQGIIPEYNASLENEKSIIEANNIAIEKYINNLQKQARAKAITAQLEEIEAKKMPLTQKRDRATTANQNAEKQRNHYSQQEQTRSAQIDAGDGKVIVSRELTEAGAKVVEANRVLKHNKELLAGINDELAELERQEKELIDYAKKNGNKLIVDSPSTTQNNGGSSTDSNKASAETKAAKQAKQEIATIKDAQKQAEAQLYASYNAGETTYSEMQARRHEILINSLQQQRDTLIKYQQDTGTIELEIERATQAQMEQYRKQSDSEIEARRQQAIITARDNFYNRQHADYQNQQVLNEALYIADIEAYQARLNSMQAHTEEYLQTKAELEQLERDHAYQREQALQQQLQQLRSQWLKSSAAEQRSETLSNLDTLHANQLLSEEEYQRARLNIIKYYNQQEADEERRKQEEATQQRQQATQGWIDNWNDLLKYASFAVNGMTTLMSGMSSYYQAQSQYEQNVTQKKYDRLIELAGNNATRTKALEKKKQKELAAIKSKANAKALKMEMAQAIAQNAVGVLGAYMNTMRTAPYPASLVLAPIAAGIATAAGAIQIATIKKQHQAQEAGYYEGGFTGGRSYRKEAGVVHQGEFVANHQAVNNPDILPALNLIDRAQRQGFVSSLTAEDVQAALPLRNAQTVSNSNIINNNQSNIQQTAPADNSLLIQTVSALNATLQQGIRATVSVDGNDGIAHQLNRYNRLRGK